MEAVLQKSFSKVKTQKQTDSKHLKAIKKQH